MRRHRLFLVLLGLGTVLRVVAMVAYRPAIFYIDSLASYLLPLPNLDPSGQDPIGYDMYLLGPLLRVGNITLVVAVQHLLGLGLATAGYALLVRKGARPWLAALGVAPVLLDAYQVQIEHNVMADVLFLALVVGALIALVWSERLRWPLVVTAGLALGLATTVREVGELLLVPLLAYPLIVAGGRWRHRTALAGAALLAFAVPVGAYAAYYHHASHRGYAISHAGANALYGRVATFVDCSTLELPDPEYVLCPSIPVKERPGPDFWAHDPSSPFFVLQAMVGDAADGIATDFVKRVVAHQPLDFASSVGRDAVKVFSWGRDDHSASDPPVERWRFQIGTPLFEPLVTIDSISELTHRYGDGDPVAQVPLTGLLRAYQLTVGYTPGPVLGLAIVAVGFGVFGRSRWRWPALLFLATGVLLLLGGDVVMFSWRYQLPAYLLLPLAAVLAVPRRPWPGFPEPADTAALATLDPDLELPPVVVLIAAYNEAGGLGPVLDGIPASCLGYPVGTVVVVDGASDGTADVARAHSTVTLEVPVNRGQGAALRLGYHVAARYGARYIVTTDADGQYDIDELPRLLEPLVTGQADFVTGSRQLGRNESTDQVRRVGTRFFAALVSLLTGQRVTDTSFGFRAMRAEVATGVSLTQPQYQSSELLIGVLARGYRVVECPLTMHRRAQGRSKKGNNLLYGARYARVVLGTWWRERNTTRSRSTKRTRKSVAYVAK